MFDHLSCDPCIVSIWKSKCLPKLKVFLWLLCHNRLNTKAVMIRKNWHVEEGPACILCDSGCIEDWDHLFFTCPFVLRCWETMEMSWPPNAPILSRVIYAKNAFQGPCFLEIFAAAAWNIWKVRNEAIFQHIPPNLRRWQIKTMADASLHRHRVKDSLVQPILLWVRDHSNPPTF